MADKPKNEALQGFIETGKARLRNKVEALFDSLKVQADDRMRQSLDELDRALAAADTFADVAQILTEHAVAIDALHRRLRSYLVVGGAQGSVESVLRIYGAKVIINPKKMD